MFYFKSPHQDARWQLLDGLDGFIHPDPFPSQGKWKRVGKKRMRGKLPRKKKKNLYGTRRSRAKWDRDFDRGRI